MVKKYYSLRRESISRPLIISVTEPPYAYPRLTRVFDRPSIEQNKFSNFGFQCLCSIDRPSNRTSSQILGSNACVRSTVHRTEQVLKFSSFNACVRSTVHRTEQVLKICFFFNASTDRPTVHSATTSKWLLNTQPFSFRNRFT